MGYGIRPRKDSWYPSMTDYLPRRDTGYRVHARASDWKLYVARRNNKNEPGRWPARSFTLCSFCKAGQLTTKGWAYRKHYNTGSPMWGPMAQHCCPACLKKRGGLAKLNKDTRVALPLK